VPEQKADFQKNPHKNTRFDSFLGIIYNRNFLSGEKS